MNKKNKIYTLVMLSLLILALIPFLIYQFQYFFLTGHYSILVYFGIFACYFYYRLKKSSCNKYAPLSSFIFLIYTFGTFKVLSWMTRSSYTSEGFYITSNFIKHLHPITDSIVQFVCVLDFILNSTAYVIHVLQRRFINISKSAIIGIRIFLYILMTLLSYATLWFVNQAYVGLSDFL